VATVFSAFGLLKSACLADIRSILRRNLLISGDYRCSLDGFTPAAP
jgi:hypothetical protein